MCVSVHQRDYCMLECVLVCISVTTPTSCLQRMGQMGEAHYRLWQQNVEQGESRVGFLYIGYVSFHKIISAKTLCKNIKS